MTPAEGLATRVVRIATTTDRLLVVAEARDEISVDGDAGAELRGDVLTLDAHSRLAVRVPTGTSLVIGSTSGRVAVQGTVGSCSVSTESGRVEVEHATRLDVRGASSRVVVGQVDGECRVHVLAGRIEIGSCGGADVSTTSGRIRLDDVRGDATAHCGSARVEVHLSGAHDVEPSTVSGRIEVTHPPGVSVDVITDDIAGGVAGPVADRGRASAERSGAHCTVVARSVTGRVTVGPR